jgi:sporulation protein YlmC with PRC-barrel domain
MSDLVGATVRDPSGQVVGTVSDVRLVQDGPRLGDWGRALRIQGLVISPRHRGGWLGYERDRARGPWLIRALSQWLHKDSVFASWADVASVQHRQVELRSPSRELPPVPQL